MRYRLTFTVNDKSEDAKFVDRQFHDNKGIKLNWIAKWGCDVAKVLDQNPDHCTYSLYDAELLED